MYDERQQRHDSNRTSLLECLFVAKERARKGKENEAKLQQLLAQKTKLETDLKEFRDCGNHLIEICKNVESYARQHQDSARNILEMAIMTAGNLVPDAGTKGIHLQSDEHKRVSVVNANGQNINMREGGGYRAVLGALLRYACLKAQPDALQFILFDEYFFTLSDTTTQAMKDIFTAMKKDLTIVCIEQRKNDTEYTFKKDDNGTTVVSKTL